MRTRPTIKDIAAQVGVSHTTVSYVMSGNTTQKISEETRQAVLEAARKLHYVPNGAARSLRKNSINCISVAMEKAVTHNRFGGLLQGIRDELSAEGYWLMLFDFSSSDNLYPDYLDSVLQRRTDGIIYVSSDGTPPELEWRKIIESNDLPFVACDCCPEEKSLASISFDYERGAFEVACRLFGEGAHRILYWRPNHQTSQESYREEGLRRACALYPGAELSISMLPNEIVENTPFQDRYSAFSRICKQYLAQDVIPRIASFESGDAIVCSWGVMVRHLCATLGDNPRQLKIAILSDAEVPVATEARVLTSRPNFQKGGKECAKLLLQQIREKQQENRIVIAPDVPTYIEL
ncbi:MAG: LacI family DNA-binding transcriptional regulator [Lachnospiraceae bacterium]